MTDFLVVCNYADSRHRAAALATALDCQLLLNIEPEMLEEPSLAIVFGQRGVEIAHTGRKAPGPVRCDFESGAVNHRRQFGGGKGQMIAKACGVQSAKLPHILDATAGLGRDAFVLATLGCQMTLLERNPAVHSLLYDGLARASESDDLLLREIIGRMELLPADALQYLLKPQCADVVYLDPMFPERQKSAEVKKEMKAFHALVGADEDADQLLTPALQAARYRVVVKRPRKAPFLADEKPSFSLDGKSSRFDVYALRKLP